MKSLQITERIIELWSRFVGEVQNKGALNYTDQNRESQNLLVSVFQIVFQLPGLRNLDVTDEANHPGIDLADEDKRVAFQITSDKTSKKVKETLEKFTKYKQYQKYDQLFIFILTEKQRHYSSDFASLVPPSFSFEAHRDILDCAFR